MIVQAPIHLAECECGYIFHAAFDLDLPNWHITYLTAKAQYALHSNKGHDITWLKSGTVTFV